MYYILGVIVVIIMWFVYDKYVQRKHQLLTNYPIIGRMRYLFEALREPLRQYFADEEYYDSRDKLDWVYNASRGVANYSSFAPSQPLVFPKYMIKHSNIVLNNDEVENDFSVTFGENRAKPFVTKSVVGRSAMSDGSISPEGTRAFAIGAYSGGFPINTGEGGLTSNFLVTHSNYSKDYMEILKPNWFYLILMPVVKLFFNENASIKFLRFLMLRNNKAGDSFLYSVANKEFYRPKWNAPLDSFPKEVPNDIADIIFQISSGMYSVRDYEGNFDEERYKKVMSFCKMTEIKIAQGAKQTGGKLAAEKVTDTIAYYRNMPAHKNAFSPNRFPFANTTKELFDFVGRLQTLSNKPVGIKIVISNKDNIAEIAKEIRARIDANNSAYPDFVSIDSGSGGSATAPLETMQRIGLDLRPALHVVTKEFKKYDLFGKIKIIASGKHLTPDDIIVTKATGADFIQIARAFMMSAGCIRARHCSGINGRKCHMGLATQDKSLRASYFTSKHAEGVRNYHKQLIDGVKSIMCVMGIKNFKDINKEHIMYAQSPSEIYNDIDKALDLQLKI